MFIVNLSVYKSKNHYNPRYIQEEQVLKSIYPNFWKKVLSKIRISEIYIFLLRHVSPIPLLITYHIFGKKLILIAFRYKFYQIFYLWLTFLVSQSWLIWKSLLSYLIQNSLQQDYLLELYILPLYPSPGLYPPLTKRQ